MSSQLSAAQAVCVGDESARLLARRMLRAWLLGSWLIAMGSLLGCDSETTVVPRTQLTLRLYASQEVFEAMATVRVQTFSGVKLVDMKVFPKAELNMWPIDVPVIPEGDNDSASLVEFVAEASDAAGKVLVQQRALAAFVPRKKHVLEVFLARCGTLPFGELCEANSACRGDQCLTCNGNATCAPTPVTPITQLPALNIDESPVNRDAPWVRDSSVDAGTDAGIDAGPDGGPDAGPDSGSDSGPDSGPEAGIDGGADSGSDAGVDAGDAGPPQWDGGKFWCGDNYFWQPTFASGKVPAGSPVLANPTITPEGDGSNPGARNQHICRVLQADGTRITGKANSFVDGPNAGKLDFGCYFARFDPETQSWQGEGVDAEGVSFQMFVPPSVCQLNWVKWSAGQLIPKNALILAADARWQPFYACRFEVKDQPQSTGLHIGRVSGNLGDVCRMQFWGKLLSSDTYEILVQDFPPVTD